jgi:hypothetical protein
MTHANTAQDALARGSVAEIGAAYRSRSLSVIEAVKWYVDRIETISKSGPALNAVRTVNEGHSTWRASSTVS